MIFMRSLYGSQNKLDLMYYKLLLRLLVLFSESIRLSKTQEVNKLKPRLQADLMDQSHHQEWEEVPVVVEVCQLDIKLCKAEEESDSILNS